MKAPVTPRQPPRNGQGSAQTRHAHPLLGAFPLVVMTLATFLVLFTLMMARLKAGADPAPSKSTSSSLLARTPGVRSVRTRTSGVSESGASATSASAAEESTKTPAAVLTRASGAASTSEAGDE